MGMLEYALAYITPNGCRPALPVIPCNLRKEPILPEWSERPLTTPEEVKTAWAKKPNAAIGILTGKRSGLLVIDIDENHTEGISGKETLEDLEKELGPLPDGPQVLTPSGGLHLWFKYPAKATIPSAVAIAPGIDIRADGGQVIAPPSRCYPKRPDGSFADTPKEYQWELSSYPNETPLPDLPPKWIAKLQESNQRENTTKKAAPTRKSGKTAPPAPAAVGTRNDTIFKYGCSLRAMGGEMDAIRAALDEYNRSLKEPLPQRELEATIASIARYQKGEPKAQGRPPKADLTLDAVAQTLEQMGYQIRLNAITREFDITGTTPGGRTPTIDRLALVLRDALIAEYKGATTGLLQEMLAGLAWENEYNPILQLIDGTAWDGQDRLAQLYAIYGLEEDPLSQALIHKWLLQAIALLFNREQAPFQPEGCLTLCGKQGLCKTSFFKKMALRSNWFEGGAVINAYDKDTTRRIVQSWITELGEADYTTGKTSASFLNGFITNGYDSYRLPYAREDTRQPRRASLGATCNEPNYIADPNGSRRWWTVPIEKAVTWDEFNQLDALQLWAQIYSEVKPLSYDEKGRCFRLTEQEKSALEDRNAGHKTKTKAQAEVEDIFTIAEQRDYSFAEMTISEFKTRWATLTRYSVHQIGQALKAIGKGTDKGPKGKRVALLPYPPED